MPREDDDDDDDDEQVENVICFSAPQALKPLKGEQICEQKKSKHPKFLANEYFSLGT
jgi:hypothetical protein